jgi:protein-tyrosine kinase
MSRVDEALRLARNSAGVRGTRDAVVPDDLRTQESDPSILDRYSAERPADRISSERALETYRTERPADDHVVDRAVAPAIPSARPTLAHGLPSARVTSAASARGVRFNPALEGKLVASGEILPVAMEQYRRLAAVLHDMRLQNGPQTLTVSSSTLHEGKTLTIANLALTLSESYRQRVLLIDADLRRPSLHDVFGIANGPGLVDIGRGAAVRPPLVEISPCLHLLTAGQAVADPLAILTSESVRATVLDAASRFDWVLIDTPPVGLLPDAQLVARLTDGVLFVIAAGATPYALVKRCIAELGADRIVGTVLNGVERGALPRDNYGYYSDGHR